MRRQTDRRSSSILAALACCMALQMTGLMMLQPLFARRFDSLGAGVKALGASAMAYALTSTVAAPLIGVLADRFGRRAIILVSLAAQVLAFSGYLLAASAWLLILLRGLSGVFTAGLLPAMTGIVGGLAPENRRAQWIGIVNGGASAGWVVAPLLGGLLYDRFGYVLPFATSIAMAVGALLLALFRIRETQTPAAHPSGLHSAWTLSWQALPARSPLLLLILVTMGAMLAWAFVESRFTFYAYDDLSWTSSQLGLVTSAYGVAFMLGEFALGQLSDRLGRKPVLVLGLALFSAQFVGLVLLSDMTWISMSFVVAGLGNALYDPALSAMVLDLTPPEHSAGMIGLKSTASSLGNLLGSALLVVAPVARPQAAFVMATALVVMLTLASGLALRSPASTSPRLSGAASRRATG